MFIAPPREKVSSKTASRRLSVGTDVDVEDDMRGSSRALEAPGRWSPGVSSNGSSRSPVQSPSRSQRSGFATGEDSEEEGYNAWGGTTSGWSLHANAVSRFVQKGNEAEQLKEAPEYDFAGAATQQV